MEWRHPVRSTWALFANKWWTVGLIVATAAWGFHVAALALAPISLVQSVIAGGLVLLTPMADRVFGLHVTRREWVGVAIAAAGLALLAATLGDGAKDAHDDYEAATLVVYVGLLAAAAAACCWAVLGDRGHAGPALAVASGLLWGGSDVAIKAQAAGLGSDPVGTFLHPLVAVITVLSLIGLVVSARSLQLGPPVAVIAITSAAANVVTIAAGPIVFAEPLPDEPLALAVRIVAFTLVIAGAVLTPGPHQGETLAPEPARA